MYSAGPNRTNVLFTKHKVRRGMGRRWGGRDEDERRSEEKMARRGVLHKKKFKK